MRFKIEAIMDDGSGKLSASAVALTSSMHVSIFEMPKKAKKGDIVEASPIKSGGGCSVFYKFESFDK